MRIGPAPVADQDADMDSQQMLRQGLCRVEGHGGEVPCGFRRYGLPARALCLLNDGGLWRLVVMQVRIPAVLYGLFSIPAVFQGKLHVALSACQPDFSQVYLFPAQGLCSTGDGQG